MKRRVQPSTGGKSGSMTTAVAVLVAACAGILLGWYFFGVGQGHAAQSASLTTVTMERDSFPALHERASQLGQHNAANTSEQAVNPSSELAQLDKTETNQVASSQNEPAPGPAAIAASGAEKSNETANNQASSSNSQIRNTVMSVAEIPAEGNMPAIPISVSAREACEGTSVKFQIEAEIVDGNYLWNFGDGSFSNQPNPEHRYEKAGTYDITLSVTSNKDGVIRTKTMDQLIVINPKPEASFDFEFVGMDAGHPIVAFENSSRRANHAQWVIANQFSEEINPVTRIDQKGVHNIELVVSNDFGCDNRVTKVISLNEDYALMAPARFSPNGDGTFDTFMPRTLMNGEYDFTMRIYNGEELIYETTEASKPWDGHLPDGSMAEVGESFTWMVLLHRPKGDKFYSGDVSVVR
jgi:PKD repeat protein